MRHILLNINLYCAKTQCTPCIVGIDNYLGEKTKQ